MPAATAGILWLLAALVTAYWLLQVWGRESLVPVAAMAGKVSTPPTAPCALPTCLPA